MIKKLIYRSIITYIIFVIIGGLGAVWGQTLG